MSAGRPRAADRKIGTVLGMWTDMLDRGSWPDAVGVLVGMAGVAATLLVAKSTTRLDKSDRHAKLAPKLFVEHTQFPGGDSGIADDYALRLKISSADGRTYSINTWPVPSIHTHGRSDGQIAAPDAPAVIHVHDPGSPIPTLIQVGINNTGERKCRCGLPDRNHWIKNVRIDHPLIQSEGYGEFLYLISDDKKMTYPSYDGMKETR